MVQEGEILKVVLSYLHARFLLKQLQCRNLSSVVVNRVAQLSGTVGSLGFIISPLLHVFILKYFNGRAYSGRWLYKNNKNVKFCILVSFEHLNFIIGHDY